VEITDYKDLETVNFVDLHLLWVGDQEIIFVIGLLNPLFFQKT
jgi:hypothetical protein